MVRLIHRTPSLVPQQLAMLAAQEKALASAIAERVGSPADSAYPAAVLAALRIVVNQWMEPGREPSAEVLGRQVDLVIAELAAGLDRP